MYDELVRARARLWGIDEAAADERIRRHGSDHRTAAPDRGGERLRLPRIVAGLVRVRRRLVLDAAEQSG